jgi:phage terminase large subunit-like protein
LEEQRKLAEALTPRRTKYIPATWEPLIQQAAFLLLPHREAFYGGSAGGGKSEALLAGALQYADQPGYAAIIFRRELADLKQPDALIPRARAWLRNTDASWNDNDHQWTFPSGAVLKFAYLQHDNDLDNYQGAAFQYVGFDELTQFPEAHYTYLLSRTRRPAEMLHIPLRVRSAGNPGGRGHAWVKARFIDNDGWYVDKKGRRQRRVFVPARLTDNRHLDRDSYEANLDELDPVKRAQLLDGDWNVRPAGKMFRREWFKMRAEYPVGLRWVRYWDQAATEDTGKNDPDWTAGALVAVRRLGDGASEVWVRDVRRIRGSPGDVEDFIKGTAQEDGPDVEIHIEEEGGSSGKNNTYNYVTRVLFGYAVFGHPKRTGKMVAWKPLSGQAQAGNVFLVVGEWNEWWIEEAVSAPNPGVHDDGLDAVAGGLAKAAEGTPFVLVGAGSGAPATADSAQSVAAANAGLSW